MLDFLELISYRIRVFFLIFLFLSKILEIFIDIPGEVSFKVADKIFKMPWTDQTVSAKVVQEKFFLHPF